MTNTISKVLLTTGILLGALALVSAAYADTRSSVRGGSSSPSVTPTSSSPVSFPGFSNGGISNTTSGVVQSGGNTGGEVETGDENVSVHVVNVGPTNSNTVVTSESEEDEEEVPAEPEETCDSRVSRCQQGVRNR